MSIALRKPTRPEDASPAFETGRKLGIVEMALMWKGLHTRTRSAQAGSCSKRWLNGRCDGWLEPPRLSSRQMASRPDMAYRGNTALDAISSRHTDWCGMGSCGAWYTANI